MRHIGTLAMALALALAARACLAAEPAAKEAPKLNVFVTILPQQTFVERIGGEHVNCGVLVGFGQSPHTFEPTPKQMTDLARARLFFALSWPFEKRLLAKTTAANPNLKVIDTRAGVPLRTMAADELDPDEPGQKAGEPDPHIWTSPRLVRIQAATIERALAAEDPAHAADYEKNLRAFQEDLDRVDAKIAKALAPLKGKAIFVYHPAFGYFADAYGLKQVPVEVEGKEPSARHLGAFIERAKAATAVAEAIGGAVVPLDDLAPNYLENLQVMAEKIQKALQ